MSAALNLEDWTRIGAMNLPSEFVLVPRPSSSCSIFWRRDGFEDEDEGRGRAREYLAEERFMEWASVTHHRFIFIPPASLVFLK